jgi:IS1 transposase
MACHRSPQWDRSGVWLWATAGCRLAATPDLVGTVWHHEVLHRGGGAYERHSDPEQHQVGKENTQTIESHHLKLRTRSKWLVRRTTCFAKTTTMHDRAIGLFINRYELGGAL